MAMPSVNRKIDIRSVVLDPQRPAISGIRGEFLGRPAYATLNSKPRELYAAASMSIAVLPSKPSGFRIPGSGYVWVGKR
jgi:hypothetical protein